MHPWMHGCVDDWMLLNAWVRGHVDACIDRKIHGKQDGQMMPQTDIHYSEGKSLTLKGNHTNHEGKSLILKENQDGLWER